MAMLIGERIREVRLAQKRSLADVAGRANISVATLSRIENEKQSVDVAMFLEIAAILQVAPQDLLLDVERKGPESLAGRIAALGSRERQELWRDLATEQRMTPARKHDSELKQVGQHLDELVAQVEFLREELDLIRKRIRKR